MDLPNPPTGGARAPTTMIHQKDPPVANGIGENRHPYSPRGLPKVDHVGCDEPGALRTEEDNYVRDVVRRGDVD